jgi:hypothetical protein
MFDAGGGYVMAGERGGLPKFKSARQATTGELAAATQDFFAANFGTGSVSEADKTLTQHFDGALRPNNEGTDVKSTVSLTADELKLINIMPSLPGRASNRCIGAPSRLRRPKSTGGDRRLALAHCKERSP